MSTSHLKDLPDLTRGLQGVQLQLGCAQHPVGLEQPPVCVRGTGRLAQGSSPSPRVRPAPAPPAHPLWTTSNLMPLVWMALRKPRWLRLMQSLNCSLNSTQGMRTGPGGKREGSGYGFRFSLHGAGVPPSSHGLLPLLLGSPGESVFLITLVLSF